MELILWRHADAENGIPDSERKLTTKGIRQANRMAKWLRLRLPAGVRVMASPAQRAQQTARALTPDFETVKAIDVTASAQDVLRACGWPGKVEAVVVGHQPTLGETAALLLTDRKEQWSLKKSAIVWISHYAGDHIARGHLRAALSPDLLWRSS